MKLLNFELVAPSFAIELVGLDFAWNLHNAGKFLSVNVNVENNTALMKWIVGGHPAIKYSGCSLIFSRRSIEIDAETVELNGW